MNELLPRLGIRYRSTVVDVGFGRADELLGLADLWEMRGGAKVCKQEGAILVVDFSAFPNSWLMKSNMKWRLHHPRNLLGRPLDRHPGFSKTNLEGCFKSAGLKIRTYDEVLIGDFGDHRIPMFLAVGEPA